MHLRFLCLMLGLSLGVRAETAAGSEALAKETSPTPNPTPTETASSEATRPMTLEKAYDLAMASDESLRIALLEIRKRESERWSALTRLGPTITASAGVDKIEETRDLRTDRPPVIYDPYTKAGEQTETNLARILWQQTLFDFTTFPAWKQARMSVEIAQLRHRFAVRQVLFGVANAYYSVLKQERAVAIEKETLALALKQQSQAQKRLDLGDAARTDLLSATAAAQAARRVLITSEGELAQRRFVLAQILGLDPAGPALALAEPAEAQAGDEAYEVHVRTALARREDYQASLREVDQGLARRKEVYASYGPRLVAQANYDWAEVDSNLSNSDRQNSWAATVAVQVPIFTGGQREVDLARTRVGVKQSRLESEKLAKSIREEVHAAWIDVGTLRETIAALVAEEEAAGKNHSAQETSYSAGTSTNLDVLAALRDLNRTRMLLSGVRHDYQVALRNLERAQATFAPAWVDTQDTKQEEEP